MLTIYKASAGSGKTFNLTRDYIRYLIAEKRDDGQYRLARSQRSRHSHILAITFTNKATAEMSERIIKSLALLSGLTVEGESGSPYEAAFVEELQCTPEELREASGRALKDLLFDYAYFNVSTIDSFFQSVLRLFTREVELPDNFAVDLDNTRAITIGLGEILNSVNRPAEPGTPKAENDKWLKQWLMEYMEGEMKEGRVFNLFSTTSKVFTGMVKSFQDLMSETAKRNMATLRDYYSEPDRIVKLRNRLAEIKATRYGELKRKCEALLAKGIAPEVLSKTMGAHVRDWLAEKCETGWNATLQKIAEDPEAAFLSDATLKKNGLPPRNSFITPEVLEDVRRIMDAAQKCLEYDSTLRPIARNIFKLGLLGRILDNIAEYCRENNLVLLSETNSILQGIINNDETPFLYEKLGYNLNHYLIDEFQDTSVMQWENLRPLLLESLSRGKDNLIIGDEKQSIYRFRNADPELLGHVVADNVTANSYWVDASLKLRGQALDENSNWRSAEEVTGFNNTIFHFMPRLLDRSINGGVAMPGAMPITATYSGVIQQIDPKRLKNLKPGYVKAEFFKGSERDKSDATIDNRWMEFIEREIRRLLGEGGYRPADIAILVRSHTDAANIINKLLAAMEREDDPLPRFAIMNNEAMMLGSSKTVQLIVSILRLVNLPEFLEPDKQENPNGKPQRTNAYRRSKLINRFHYYLHCEHPATDGKPGRPYTPDEALAAALLPESEPEEDDYRSLLDMDCLNLPGVVERIIGRYVPRQAADEEAIFLSAFQDAVLEYSSRGNHDIRQFVQWWDISGKKIGVSSPADLDAVKVMTIHQSKGLGFPCVILPLTTDAVSAIDGGRPEWLKLDKEAISAHFDIDASLLPGIAPLKMCPEMAYSPFLSKKLHEHLTRETIDELNVCYVAFTRASRELLISAPYPARYKDSTSPGALLYNIISSTDAAALNNPSAGLTAETRSRLVTLADKMTGEVFTYGTPTVKEQKEQKEQSTSSITIDRYTLIAPQHDRMANARSEGKESILRAKIDAIDPFDPTEPRHIGTFLHNVLSMVTTPDRLEPALKRMFYKYRIPPEMRNGLRERLLTALGEPEAARWFDGFERVITERTLSWKADGKILTNRPDRIVYLPDGSIEIVDYKFVNNIPGEEWTDQRYRRYRDQVHDYSIHIGEATGAPTRGYLWFISDTETQIVQVI